MQRAAWGRERGQASFLPQQCGRQIGLRACRTLQATRWGCFSAAGELTPAQSDTHGRAQGKRSSWDKVLKVGSPCSLLTCHMHDIEDILCCV